MVEEGVERRLAAILAADVAGYSRLMAADEAGTHARLRALRKEVVEPKVAQHRGRVVKLTGDGALVEFGSVLDAVACAVEIQRGMAERTAGAAADDQIRLRIGVNLGDVIFDEHDIYGDGVNVAARLEGLAEPGGICISAKVHEEVKNKLGFGYQDLGPQQVKNIPEPVRAYRVLIAADGIGSTVGASSAIGAGARRLAGWRWRAAAAAIALIMVGVGVAGWLRPWETPSDPIAATPDASIALDTRRIAVLPFANISASEDDAYFADGMTEEMISQLSKIGELSVIARTSTLRYQDTDKGIAEIGRELRVGTILEGSVRKDGNQVRITAQLIDVASQAHLWSENYDRAFEGIFAIQSDIAEQVANALQITLLAGEQEQIKDLGTDDIEAYNLYLQGLFFLNQVTSEGIRKARPNFERAIEKDPEFARAYAKLADLYAEAQWFDEMPPEQARAKQRVAVEMALKLDDSLAEAHSARAQIKIDVEWDWDGAERSLRRAIALNQSYARPHMILGHQILTAVRRQHDEGIAEVRRAVDLDPWSGLNQENLGWAYYHAERYDEALAQFRKIEEMTPDAPFVYAGLCQSLAMQGTVDEAVVEIEKGVELAPDEPWLLGFLAWAYGVAGRLDDARAVIEKLESRTEGPAPPMVMAYATVGMGDKERALHWLEKAYEEGAPA